MAFHQNILSTIGNTPLVQLNRVVPAGTGRVYAKLESFNPMGSVKDRPALAMVLAAERAGLLCEGSVIAEATSGNTGLGLAMIGAVRGYRVVLFVEAIDRLNSVVDAAAALGAEVITADDFSTAVRQAEAFQAATQGVFVPHQFRNPANPEVHERTTAQEIIRDAGPALRAFVGSFGSGGTITGIGRALKRHDPTIEVVLVEPDTVQLFSGGPVGCSQIHGLGPTFRPPVMEGSVHDRVMQVSARDGRKFARRLAREEGILCGPSSGALAWAAAEVAQNYGAKDIVVTVFPDTGNRYLETGLYHPEMDDAITALVAEESVK
jgi:cysteine synthase